MTRLGVPLPGERVAGGARLESAAAILGIAAQGVLTVALDHRDAGAPDALNGRLGIGAIGGDVAGTQDAGRGDAKGLGFRQKGFGRFQVAVGAAEDKHGAVENTQVENGSHHDPERRRRSAVTAAPIR